MVDMLAEVSKSVTDRVRPEGVDDTSQVQQVNFLLFRHGRNGQRCQGQVA